MKYVVRTFLAMALFAFCWVAIGYGIFQMLGIGTCASGGPYVSARECPDGSGALFFSLFGGILGLFVAGGIYLTRGTPPGAGGSPRTGAVVIWFWTGLFWSLAVGCFLAVWGPEANPGPGGETGGLIVGFMGAIMGAGGLLALNFRGGKRPAANVTDPIAVRLASAASRFGTAPDPVGRLDTLDRLRREGTLTDAEFQTLKAKIVREG